MSAIASPLDWATAPVRRRFRAWWQARVPRTDTLLLTQRNIYILPTRAGFLFAGTLLLLLVASINYQLNLGYLLTFVLAGAGIVSMHLTHATLRGLTLHLHPVGAVHAGDAALLDATLTSAGAARWGIGLAVDEQAHAARAWTDVPRGGQAAVQLSFVPAHRGRHGVPALIAETRFPLGLFRAWSVWRPAAQLIVYPAPERPGPPLPPASPVADTAGGARLAQGADADPQDGYLVVRQSNAHAWAEFWERGRGWVRADPTAAVAPERIVRSRRLQAPQGVVATALGGMSPALLAQLRRGWESLNNRWNQWVLNYSRGQQIDLLKDIGFDAPSWEDLALLLIAALSGLSAAGALWAWWERCHQDPWTRQLSQVRRALRPLGLAALPHETPRALAFQVQARCGSAGSAVVDLLVRLEHQRYGRNAAARPAGSLTRALQREVRGLVRAGAARQSAA